MKKDRKKPETAKRSLTFLLLYYWGKCLGINPLTSWKINKLHLSFFSLFYGCSLGTIYCYFFYRVLLERSKFFVSGETPIAVITNLIGIICQWLETSLTLFSFALHQNRIIALVKSFYKVENISRNLGIPKDKNRSLRKFGIYVIFNNILYLVSLSISHIMLFKTPNYNVFLWASFNLPRIVSFNMGMLFVFSLISVKLKFRQLNETVRFLIRNDHHKGNEENYGFSRIPSSKLIRNCRNVPSVLVERIFMISQLHRQLRDLLNRIVEQFTPLLYFSIGNYLASLATTVYIIYEGLKDFQSMTGTALMIHFGSHSHWLLYSVFVLLVLSNVCGSTLDEANNTGNMLHAMLSRCEAMEFNQQFEVFNILSLDLLQNPVKITILGLFEVDYFFFYSNMAAAVAYITIMLQFYR